ncbi:hypothetical protein [Ideonella sp. BN130291]|uniref:hypothetical protein n=1 Tax=Ideonella sp. BN130291 TaxID=3112940 RepID=UPI002E25CA4F|nr:hypothetical protein [Ideonella sp. BN130291]
MLLELRFFREHPFALFDPVHCGDSPLMEAQAAQVRHPSLELADHLVPRLVDLQRAGNELLDRMHDALDRRSVASGSPVLDGALDSEASLTELASHLGHQSIRNLGPFGRHLVRVWDPLVLMHLLWLWPGPELRKLFGPIRSWALFLPKEVAVIDRSALDGPGVTIETTDRHQAVIDVSIINIVLREIDWRFGDIPRLGRQLWTHIMRARQVHSLQDETDLALFAQHSHRWGTGFTAHPEIQRALTLSSDGETRYRDALAQIDEGRWRTVEAELSASLKK